MASSHSYFPDDAAARSSHAANSLLSRMFLPSFSDCLFLALLVWLFVTGQGGWVGLLADGDTGWHIRTGEWILNNGQVPKVDLYSFTKGGQPWFAWEWLMDVIYAVLHGWFGLKGLLILSALAISGFGTVLFRHMVWRGACPPAVLLVTLLAIGASSIHFLARPHVVTLLFLTVSMWVIDADRRAPSPLIWGLVPLTVFWVNLHGGFLALIAILGLLVAGTAVETLLVESASREWSRVRRYTLLAALCSIATLVNPYGIRLHQHVVQYMQSDWIKNKIQEFLAPAFRSEDMAQFEVLLFLGAMTSLWLLSRREVTPALWILFWGHSALTSMRHVPLYMIVAAPYVAMGLTELWNQWIVPAPRKSVRAILADLSRDCAPACRRTSIWAFAAMAALIAFDEPVIRWPRDFPDLKFPAKMVQRHADVLTSGRLLTMDQWADYLIYHLYPKQRVFVDGRSDFFGAEFGEDYLGMLGGRWNWEELLEKHRLDTVLAPVEWPLASFLKRHPGWVLIEDDKQGLLFVRKKRSTDSAPVRSTEPGPTHVKKTAAFPNENPQGSRT